MFFQAKLLLKNVQEISVKVRPQGHTSRLVVLLGLLALVGVLKPCAGAACTMSVNMCIVLLCNAWARVTKCLKALDMYTGQSVHSTRRGNIIHMQQHLQESHKEVGKAAMCNERNAKYYTDVHRSTRFRAL